MPYVDTKQMLLDAQKGNYAIGAFNIDNMEIAQAAIEAAQELNSPIILQTIPIVLQYADPEIFFGIAKALADKATVPVALHLDHGNGYELAKKVIEVGYSSVMFDGSHYSFEENIRLTKKVVATAKENGIPVEAELGKVGGVEGDLDGGAGNYTDPTQAVEFAKATGVDSLAIAIGTAHGKYTTTPVLDKNRLKEIASLVDIPLVLHGATGVSDQDIIDCVKLGICKINFATEMRVAYSDGVKDYLKQNPEAFDPKSYGAFAKQRVKERVMAKILLCGCDGKG